MARGVQLLVLLGCISGARVQADELLIAAASDLVFCLEELNAVFIGKHPDQKVKMTTGSSGNFFAQIKNGAPYDLFFAADLVYPEALIKAGLAESSTLTRYGIGRIVLWSVKTNLDVGRGLALLRDGRIRTIAIANPEHAPYGRAARAALEHEKLWALVQSKLVLGENISQAAQFVQTGNADVGLVALSLVLSPKLAGQGRYLEIPPETYPVLVQGAVLLRRGSGNPAAREYLKFIESSEARAVFERYGFRRPLKSE